MSRARSPGLTELLPQLDPVRLGTLVYRIGPGH